MSYDVFFVFIDVIESFIEDIYVSYVLFLTLSVAIELFELNILSSSEFNYVYYELFTLFIYDNDKFIDDKDVYILSTLSSFYWILPVTASKSALIFVKFVSLFISYS